MDILLIRHGETDWNRIRRMQGHIDIPLNDVGRRQAQALAAALADERPQAIYTSDLQRARDTAQPTADMLDLPVTLDPGLRERCFGAFEGLMYEEIGARYPQAFAGMQARDPHVQFPAGERKAETLTDFYWRAVGAVARIARRHEGSKLAIVTHGGVLDCLYREATGKAIDAERDFSIVNAAINRLRWQGGRFTLLAWGDDAHLSGAGLDEIDRSHPAA
jgi:probable phosphoglycerate mutase